MILEGDKGIGYAMEMARLADGHAVDLHIECGGPKATHYCMSGWGPSADLQQHTRRRSLMLASQAPVVLVL